MLIFLIIIFSAIGMGYIFYGKKQQNYVALISGIFLCIYPYFFHNPLLIIIIGLLLSVSPFIIKV